MKTLHVQQVWIHGEGQGPPPKIFKMTGKANLKIYEVNMRDSAIITVTKISGGDMSNVKVLAFSMTEYLLSNIISGDITNKSIMKVKTKSLKKLK